MPPQTVTEQRRPQRRLYTLNAMLSSQGTSTSSGGDYVLGGVWSGSPDESL